MLITTPRTLLLLAHNTTSKTAAGRTHSLPPWLPHGSPHPAHTTHNKTTPRPFHPTLLLPRAAGPRPPAAIITPLPPTAPSPAPPPLLSDPPVVPQPPGALPPGQGRRPRGLPAAAGRVRGAGRPGQGAEGRQAEGRQRGQGDWTGQPLLLDVCRCFHVMGEGSGCARMAVICWGGIRMRQDQICHIQICWGGLPTYTGTGGSGKGAAERERGWEGGGESS